MGWLQQAIRLFLPEEDRFFDYMLDAAIAADHAALHFLELTEASGRAAQLVLVERIRDDEHDGDKAFRVMTDALDRTFVTPVDREDLYHATSAIEDVSDFISSTANHLTVHHMETLPDGTRELAEVLKKSTALFKEGVSLLRTRKNDERIRACCRELRTLEHEADVIFRTHLGDLFNNEKDAIKLIKHKEFLEGLEESVDRCCDVGNSLEAMLIKNN